tara:strand:+ start:504 stop:902 length:399 start_codon:yes stop_codon:yes gene_type:complete
MFNIEYVKNLKWVNHEHDAFDCIVKYEEFDEEHESTICRDDLLKHIQIIWNSAMENKYGGIDEFIPPPEDTIENTKIQVRHERDSRLAECDWTQASDVPASTKELWVNYRQALRDITLQEEFPLGIVWPEKP